MENNANDFEKYIKELDKKIWITKGARFNAHQRLMSIHTWSVAATAIASVYILIVSIMCYLPFTSSDPQKHDILSIFAIALSVFILVFRLLESSKSYELKARNFHDCGRKLSGTYDNFAHFKAINGMTEPNSSYRDKILEIIKEYDLTLDQYNENHKMIDVELFKLQHNKEFSEERLNRVSVYFRNWIYLLPYITIIFMTPILVMVLFLVY